MGVQFTGGKRTGMADESQTNENRRAVRRRTLKEGTIVFDDGQHTMQCKILDTSETGARLHVPDVMFMPEQFLFKIRCGAIRNCQVIWKDGPTVGVQFTGGEGTGMADGSQTNENRRAVRRPTVKEGMIVFNHGHCTMQCKILDTSETGARLHVPEVLFMPEQFLLKIPDGAMRNCEVIWKKGPTVGVQFTD